MPFLYRKINTQRDLRRTRNKMVDDYPLGMSDCEVVGINGDCGLDCPVLVRGDCPSEREIRRED